MDNDNKIEKNGTKKIQTHDEVLLFLDEELKSLKKGSNKDAYDIKKEYAKTAKNKSPFTILVLLGATIVVFATSFFITKIISKQNQQITVNLEEFDSLNLRSLLDTVFKVQADYNGAVKNKSSLEAEQTRLLKQAEASRDNELYVLESLKLEDKDAEVREKRIIDEYNRAVASIKTEYAAKIAEVDAEIEVHQKQMAEYDNSKVQQAQEQEKALNSERQLRQLEQQELTGKYESKLVDLQNSMDRLRVESQENIRKSVKEVSEKYQAEIDKLDPVINDSGAETILKSLQVEKESNPATYELIEDEHLAASVLTYKKLQQDYAYLHKKVAAIPQKHTIPSYVAANQKLVDNMSETFTSATMDLYEKNTQLKNTLEDRKQRENQILSSLLTVAKSNALIYSDDAEDDIQIFVAERAQFLVDPELGVGAEFAVGKNLIKGRIFLEEDGVYRFRLGEDVDGNPIPLPVPVTDILPGTLVKLYNK